VQTRKLQNTEAEDKRRSAEKIQAEDEPSQPTQSMEDGIIIHHSEDTKVADDRDCEPGEAQKKPQRSAPVVFPHCHAGRLRSTVHPLPPFLIVISYKTCLDIQNVPWFADLVNALQGGYPGKRDCTTNASLPKYDISVTSSS
jgi:hypothetical protein